MVALWSCLEAKGHAFAVFGSFSFEVTTRGYDQRGVPVMDLVILSDERGKPVHGRTGPLPELEATLKEHFLCEEGAEEVPDLEWKAIDPPGDVPYMLA
ncbi:hypothetical protein KSF_109950 [Reticulibacter mediterranei]|uniref:Uncharacterized protein n=1 Tax=Reticulibacter mediterranei TaxID=2778369 RepID=A0A8J3J239_9CHLR|nr:hypothetical protein [Reticulibacter mediterranei]GHP00948.1 hypothetical protein KSF_109950 [Reticulibacter mediterranei]